MLKQLFAHLVHKASFPASFSTLANKSCNLGLIKHPLLVQLDLEMNNDCIDVGLRSCYCFMHFQLPKHLFVNWRWIIGTQSSQEMIPFFFFLPHYSDQHGMVPFQLPQLASLKHWLSLEALPPSKL